MNQPQLLPWDNSYSPLKKMKSSFFTGGLGKGAQVKIKAMKNLFIIPILIILLMGCQNTESGKEGSEEKTKENNQGDSSLVQPVIVDSVRYNDSISMNSSFIPPNGIEFLIYVEEKEIYLKYPYLKFEKDSSEIGLPDIVYTNNGNEFRFVFGKSIEVMFCKRTFSELDSIPVSHYISYCNSAYKVLEKGKKWLSKEGSIKVEINRIKPNVFIYIAQSDFIKIE